MIDVDRCLRAMKNLEVKGSPRESAIASAIAMIQENPAKALIGEYIGIKNYAHFGDQREDHQYGMGPRHGTIVFEIGRTYPAQQSAVKLGADELYFLECCRDFGTIEHPTKKWGGFHYEKPLQVNLNDALTFLVEARAELSFLEDKLSGTAVEIHVPQMARESA